MNWKAVLLVCLVFFATTLITSITNITISLTTLVNATTAGNGAVLNADLVEPAGDEVDNPWAPK